MNELKVGDRIVVKTDWMTIRTPKWMNGYHGVIKKLNSKTITVVLDAYPEENHRIDYGDCRLEEKEI